jgi:flavin-binding protein dodecin
MNEPIYKCIEIIGTSTHSIEEAIKKAIARASTTVQGISWFEVLETRGNVENNSIKHYQVSIKAGFLIKD